ncbi:MAG: DUF998 domain-containing protein [Nitrososphaerales archaeon]
MVLRWREITEPKVAALFGIIAPTWALASIGISIALSPWFSWTKNALSDLGVSEVASIFNSGLIICGILIFPFIVGFAKIERTKRFGLTGSVVLLSSSVFLIGVGVFSEAFGLVHFYFSVAFFVSLILSSIILGIHFTLNISDKRLGIFTLLIGIISFIGWIVWATIHLSGVAIPETINILLASFWIIVLSIRMYKEK